MRFVIVKTIGRLFNTIVTHLKKVTFCFDILFYL